MYAGLFTVYTVAKARDLPAIKYDAENVESRSHSVGWYAIGTMAHTGARISKRVHALFAVLRQQLSLAQ